MYSASITDSLGHIPDYWIIGVCSLDPEEESLASRYLVVLLGVAAYPLVFNHSTESGFGKAIHSAHPERSGVGSVADPAWNRVSHLGPMHLAEYWSARVTIKEDHQHIRTGPYAHLRHPIYPDWFWPRWERRW
jgi:hypothetical protein